ncbi:response regulator [Sphingobium sp. H39-3-25]|uniref:ATP-binding protein n=1 Tax=Sphingobium arseniciresistens TaxID=3030834 RepID=UPI0023B9D758|nr:response regulator [Sphingobium arseniciresistens]
MDTLSQITSRSEEKALVARWARAAEAIESLSGARNLDDIVEILRSSARRIVGADGIAIVLRDGEQCHYIAEDAMEPLWAGQRFPAETCVSGWAMRHGETASIPDVFIDRRVPQDAYRQTFVRSMLMVPIGRPDAVAAVGAYWSDVGRPIASQISLLEALARAASTSLENGRLFSSLEALNGQLEQRVRERTAELENTQETLRQIQKMEIVGQLTGNVAHDFNNLLSPIMAGLDLVLAGRASADAVMRSASVAMEAAENAQTLVQRLLMFARRQPLTRTTFDLADLLTNMRALLRSTIGPRISLVMDLAGNLPAIHADRHQMELAVLNLVVNARDAMLQGGTLTLSAAAVDSDLPSQLAPGTFVRFTIADTGIGMDAATKAAATEPFFTTKPAGHGTGLGLSMVHGLAGQLGGALNIESQAGKGTKVNLWLPVSQASDAASPAKDTQQEGEGEISQGKVFLIDDNVLVRSSTREMLADLGYDVTEFADAGLAIAMLDEGFRPDIVITDHIMPGMTGAELALRLRVDHPKIAILIISGYEGIDLIAPDVVRLSKPFRQGHLKASIAAACAKTP